MKRLYSHIGIYVKSENPLALLPTKGEEVEEVLAIYDALGTRSEEQRKPDS
jgi:hypothetical protein